MNPSLYRLPNQALDRIVLPANFDDMNFAQCNTLCQYHGPMTPLRPTRARYVAVAFAMLLAIVQYLDRVCISQAAPAISRDLGLSTVEMGWVFSVFTWAYALFEVPSGWLGDRIGPRRVLM